MSFRGLPGLCNALIGLVLEGADSRAIFMGGDSISVTHWQVARRATVLNVVFDSDRATIVTKLPDDDLLSSRTA